MGLLVHDLLRPFKQPYDEEMRDFARYLWREKADGAVLVCMTRDLKLDFAARALSESGTAQAQYVCNRAIYSAQRGDAARAVDLDLVSETRPLRCVMFSRVDGSHPDDTGAWLTEMQRRFDWIGYEKHDFRSYYLRREGGKERFEIFEFAPKGSAAAGIAQRVRFESR